MMKTCLLRLSALPVLVSLMPGCATMDPDLQLASEGSEQSTLLFYRDKKFVLGGASAAIGVEVDEEDVYFLKLGNGQFSEIPIDQGQHTLLSKMEIHQAHRLNVDAKSADTICIQVKPYYSAGLSVGGGSAKVQQGGKGFSLSESECPTGDKLETLLKVDRQQAN